RAAATLCRLWDAGGVGKLTGRRLSAYLVAAPDLARALTADAGLRHAGFLSRLLIACPDSRVGTRSWRKPDAGDPALTRFYHHADALFACPAPTAVNKPRQYMPRALALSADAEAVWGDFVE